MKKTLSPRRKGGQEAQGLAQEHRLGQLQNLYQHQVLQFVYYVKIYTFSSHVYKCLSECKYGHHVYSVPTEARRGHWVILELVLQTVVSCHAGAGNQVQVRAVSSNH